MSLKQLDLNSEFYPSAEQMEMEKAISDKQEQVEQRSSRSFFITGKDAGGDYIWEKAGDSYTVVAHLMQGDYIDFDAYTELDYVTVHSGEREVYHNMLGSIHEARRQFGRFDPNRIGENPGTFIITIENSQYDNDSRVSWFRMTIGPNFNSDNVDRHGENVSPASLGYGYFEQGFLLH